MTWSGFESRIYEATLDLGATTQLESWVGDPALECGAGLDFQGQLDGRAVASGVSASKLRKDFVVCLGNLRCVGPHIMQPCAEAFWILDSRFLCT